MSMFSLGADANMSFIQPPDQLRRTLHERGARSALDIVTLPQDLEEDGPVRASGMRKSRLRRVMSTMAFWKSARRTGV
jgi:hypothetical protein